MPTPLQSEASESRDGSISLYCTLYRYCTCNVLHGAVHVVYCTVTVGVLYSRPVVCLSRVGQSKKVHSTSAGRKNTGTLLRPPRGPANNHIALFAICDPRRMQVPPLSPDCPLALLLATRVTRLSTSVAGKTSPWSSEYMLPLPPVDRYCSTCLTVQAQGLRVGWFKLE
jgi:hypothetical protein